MYGKSFFYTFIYLSDELNAEDSIEQFWHFRREKTTQYSTQVIPEVNILPTKNFGKVLVSIKL